LWLDDGRLLVQLSDEMEEVLPQVRVRGVAGGVWCWGGNWDRPVAVPGLASGVSAISTGAGGNNSCALKDGGAWCWLGGTMPVAVSGLASGVSAISAGYHHTCAVKDGGAWCWGRNVYGELGNNSTTESHVPVAVSGLESGVSDINAGEDHSCAVKDDEVWCWGSKPSRRARQQQHDRQSRAGGGAIHSVKGRRHSRGA
jgi:alpha-tubulin suppressor-like RCC1 family protein